MPKLQRPNGQWLLLAGWICVALTFGLFFGSAFAGHGELRKLYSGTLQLAVLLLALGYIARCLWFLPGRDIDNTSGGEG